MARRPYFSGNYGSALGSTANAANLIARAGEVQGQMYAKLGQQVGGAIEKYQLNKEKREAEERTAMGNLAGFSPEELTQISGSNPQLGKAIENAMSDKASPKDFQLINASSAPIVAGKARRLQEENAQIKNSLSKVNLEVAQLLKDPKVRDAIDQYKLNKVVRASNMQTIPSDTAVRLKTNESTIKTLPRKTDATLSALKASELKSDTDSAYILGQGGPAGAAKQRVEDDDLSRTDRQSQIDYRNNVGLAQLYKSLAEKNPTFAEQFTPLAALQDKLRGLTVKTPKGESVSYAEYEKLHNKEPDLYPMNNEPGAIRGKIESVNSQIYNLSREQTVQVDVPYEINDQTTQQAQPPVPAYQKALDDRGKQTQQEYMNQPGIGGMGFPFMP
jgi:hypothetical protein